VQRTSAAEPVWLLLELPAQSHCGSAIKPDLHHKPATIPAPVSSPGKNIHQ
jgi:hypothetical protein